MPTATALMNDATARPTALDFAALLAPVHDRARQSARRLSGSSAEGDDLFHEAVLRAMDKLPELRDAERFRAWFYAILLSLHRSRARRSIWRRWFSLDGPDAPDPVGEDGQRWEDARHRARRASRALAVLPAEQREAIVLFELDELSLDEVAQLQGTSIAAVKSRVSRARQALRKHYGRLGLGPSKEHDHGG